jgi:hypothetical protein
MEAGMRARSTVLSTIIVLAGALGFAKGKKDILPPYVLTAHTVSVVIDPNAGISIDDDPNANQIARRDVEAALLSWGRLEPALAGQPADLIIVIRRGNHRLVSETISDPRQNDRIGGINPSNPSNPSDSSTQIGGRQGSPPPNSPDLPGSRFPPTSAPQTEIGGQEDFFAVYNGAVAKPLDAPPAWRYISPDGLRPHSVPAVTEFRKALAAAEKAAAKNP